MANDEHFSVISQGVDAWNRWRIKNAETMPDLSGANLNGVNLSTWAKPDGVNLIGANLNKANLKGAKLQWAKLSRADLTGADLSDIDLRGAELDGADLGEANLENANFLFANLRGVNLHGAKLINADLYEADLSGADLSGADLHESDLSNANLHGAKLINANLYEVNLSRADLSGADLHEADLIGALLVETNLENANLSGCRVYGISAWNIIVNQETKQFDLLITHPYEAPIKVDDLEVAQFIYLLLNRKKLRNVLDTITSKAVLLLGRFTPERKAVLDALAEELRKHNLLPIIFDFERSTNRDFTETIKILAGLSLFVIVDITKPKSAPQELIAIVPDYQIPFVPILEEGENPYSMFVDFKKYDWVLKPILKYRTKEVLLENFRNVILEPAWKKHLELQRKKNEELEAISIEEMIAQKRKAP